MLLNHCQTSWRFSTNLEVEPRFGIEKNEAIQIIKYFVDFLTLLEESQTWNQNLTRYDR